MIDAMHAHPLARTSWLVALLAACGPTVDPPTESGAGSTTSITSTTEPITTSPGLTSTSGTSLTGVDSDSGSSSESGVLFLLPGDFVCVQGGSVPSGFSPRCLFDCDLLAQDCAVGEKCMPWANDGGEVWNSSRCSPVAPDPVPPGGTCTVEGSAVSGVDDCELGSMCWGVDPETLQGTCIAFCDALRRPSQICDDPALCMGFNDGNVPVCVTPCDPLQDDPCPDGEACRLTQGDGGFYCLPLVGGHVEGSSQHCEDATCLPSQLCVPGGSLGACEAASCCTDLCDLGDPGADAQCAALAPTQACVPVYAPGEAPMGLELVGVCAVPM